MASLSRPTDADLSAEAEAMYERVATLLVAARAAVARTVNSEMVRVYWLIGREIFESEQRGKVRAGYGDALIVRLSERLQARFRRGFAMANLKYMRLFYLTFPQLL